MKYTQWKLILVFFIAATSLSLVENTHREPRNLGLCKKEVRAYVTSERYMEDIRSVTAQAQEYIAKSMKQTNRNAIVLDVDETALSHLKYELDLDFGYSVSTWNEWLQKAEAEPILPTLELFKWAKANNVAVFFLSGNRERARASITKNLSRAGYAAWDSLYLKPDTSQDRSSQFKPKVRKEITERGYYIIVNIGDQETDFVGGYGEKAFKLPNPMYYVE